MTADGVDLYWVPLGAGPHGAPVRWVGRLYEAVVARRAKRPRRDLYHTALLVHADGATTRIELAVPVHHGARGVVAEGPVGSPLLRRFRWFRYELRCWADGPVPRVPPRDGPIRVSSPGDAAARILRLVHQFPLATWGRDEQSAGEMWNSNSLVSWLLARAGIPTDGLAPPAGGRAPGWDAGVTVARRAEPPVRAQEAREPAR
jgi:hypothetical protein